MTDTAKSPSAMTEEEPSLTVTIDGVAVAARPDDLVIEAAERAGVFIPRFCYHPQMKPVGMCRMCLVEISGPRGFGLQPACYVHVSDGQEVRTSSPKARKAQEGVLEFLLLNHPLDCPVCDKGGECPLQDQALSHGPGDTRFLEEKRHWAKPIEISPLVYLDRERCIQCARCTRFADEIAGEALIDFAFRGDEIEVATFPDRPFSSYFSGNTVQICPVGALTAAPYRFKSRPWDLEQVETTCTTCSVGCRVVAQSSAGRLVRYLGVDAAQVNQSWLCDKGRFGFESNAGDSRVTTPFVRRDGALEAVRWPEALRVVARALRGAREQKTGASVGVIGGARLTNEDAYAWSKLARTVLGTDSVDAQLDDGLPSEVVLGLPRASIEDTLGARLVILLGPDLKEELPVLYLRLRAAAVHDGLRLLECSSVPQALSAGAATRVGYLPGEAGRLAALLVGEAMGGEVPGATPEELGEARRLLAEALGEQTTGPSRVPEGGSARGEGVVVILGRPSVSESANGYVQAATIVHQALPGARFLPALRRANVHGALDMGLSPGLLPGRVDLETGRAWFEHAWGVSLPPQAGHDARAMLEAAAAGEVSVLFLLGADPLADFPDRGLARRALGEVGTVVSLASHWDRSARGADVVLPVAAADERTGSTTSIEGRITRVAQKVVPPGTAWPAWTIAGALADELGADLGLENLETISAEIERLAPSHRGVDLDVLARRDHRDGIIVPVAPTEVHITGARRPPGSPRRIDPIATPGIWSVEEQGAPLVVGDAVPFGGADRRPGVDPGARRPAMVSFGGAVPTSPTPAPRLDAYSLRLVLRRSLYDRGTLVSASSSLSPLSPGQAVRVHPSVLERLGVEDGERLRVRGPGGSLEVPALADPNLARELAVLGAHLGSGDHEVGVTSTDEGTATGEDLLAGGLVTDVRLETI